MIEHGSAGMDAGGLLCEPCSALRLLEEGRGGHASGEAQGAGHSGESALADR